MSAPVQTTLIKGTAFAERVRQVCAQPPAPVPLANPKNRRILIPGMIGGELQFALLGFIGQALRLRGATVTGLLCDELLPACTLRKVDHHESACTRWCHKNARPFIDAFGLPHRWYSELISPGERRECDRIAGAARPAEFSTFVHEGISLGHCIVRSVESFYKVGRFDLSDPAMVGKAREFLRSALYLTIIARRAIEELDIDKVLVDDGTKVDWGVFRAVALHAGIPVDVLPGSARGHCILLEPDRPGQPRDPFPLWSKWRQTPLTAAQEAALDAYFAERALRPYDDMRWTDIRAEATIADVRAAIGIPPTSRGLVFGAFPNVGYDAALTANRPAYPAAAEWIADTVRFFVDHPEQHLVVKVHPGEQILLALDPTVEFLRETFAYRPANVHILPPDTPLTAHDVLRVLDVSLVYTSTVAVEAAYLGIPTVNIGGGWHANRGLSTDVSDPRAYLALLQRTCDGDGDGAPPAPQRDVARRYAYGVFFRSAIPIQHYRAQYPHLTELRIRNLRDLLPGQDAGLDAVCRGVLYDEPVDYDGWIA